jgi:hypothetical protein
MGSSFRFRDDTPHEEPAVTLDAFLEQEDATAVRMRGSSSPIWTGCN